MIRTVASCPFCADGVVAFDDHLEIVFNPDSTKHTACDHLCFFWASLSADSWHWERIWQRGKGFGEIDMTDLLTDLVVNLTLDSLPPEYQLRAAYQLVGADTREFWVYPPAGSPEFVIFDAHAVYAYDAGKLVDAMNEMARTIRMASA